MALGAVLAGTIADRIGRKQVFTITVLLYSISTGLCAVAWNYESLLVFRFLLTWGVQLRRKCDGCPFMRKN